MKLTTQVICQVVLDLYRNPICILVANSCICSFFPIMSISSIYIIIMHTPSSFSLNSMQGSAGLTRNPKGSCFAVFTNFFQNCLAAWHRPYIHFNNWWQSSGDNPGSISSIPTGDFIRISSSISPYKRLFPHPSLYYLVFPPSSLQVLSCKDTSCATGAKLSV